MKNKDIIKNTKPIMDLLNESNNYILKASPKKILQMTGIKYKKDLDMALEYLKNELMVCMGEKHSVKEVIYELVSTPMAMKSYYDYIDSLIKKEKSFSLKEEDYNSIGVYRIINYKTKEIYIGSTISGFRNRFSQHYSSHNMEHTHELLHNGAIFEIVEIMNDLTEVEIRAKEQYWINYYKANSDYTLINKSEETVCLKEKKPKYINIKVEESIYSEVLEFLKDSGLLDKTIIK